MLLPINSFTIHNLLGCMIAGSLGAVFYLLYLISGRNRLDLLVANFNTAMAVICFSFFMMDNLVPAGVSSFGWPGGPNAQQLAQATLQWERIAWSVGVIAMVAQLHFVLYYCDSQSFLRRHIRWVYLLAIPLAATAWTDYWMTARQTPLANTSSWAVALPWMPESGPLIIAFNVAWLSLAIRNLVEIGRTARRAPAEEESREWRLIFIAFLIQILIAFAGVGAVPLGYAGIALTPIGSSLMGMILGTVLISRRIAADERQRYLEREKAVLLDSVQQPLFYVGHDLHIQWANRHMEDFLTVHAHELTGQHLRDIWPASHAANEIPPIRRSVRSGNPVREEITRPDGTTWILHCSPLVGASGSVGSIVLAMDVSEIRKAQEILRSANSKLLAAREEERGRVARDLHDSVAQSIAALQLRIMTGARDTEITGRQRVFLDNLVVECGRLASEIRQICHDLYPPTLELLGLPSAIDALCETYRSAGTQCQVRFSRWVQQIRFRKETEITLFRVTQEAMSNAIRHGHAKRISVSIRKVEDLLQLKIVDNGDGFDPERIQRPGIGVSSMKSRLEGIAGTLSISSQPGRTEVTALSPWKERPEEPENEPKSLALDRE